MELNYISRIVGEAAERSTEPVSRRHLTPISAQNTVVPNDPSFGSQWGLDQIDAPEAWFITQGSASQIIAVTDTGIDFGHPDLASKVWINAKESPADTNGDGCPGICGVDDDGDGLIDEDGAGRQKGVSGWDATFAGDDDENGFIDDFRGWDWVNGDNYPLDDNGHGTHVAGIAAAATNNGTGIAGACPNCRVMVLKAFGSNGTASIAPFALAIEDLVFGTSSSYRGPVPLEKNLIYGSQFDRGALDLDLYSYGGFQGFSSSYCLTRD